MSKKELKVKEGSLTELLKRVWVDYEDTNAYSIQNLKNYIHNDLLIRKGHSLNCGDEVKFCIQEALVYSKQSVIVTITSKVEEYDDVCLRLKVIGKEARFNEDADWADRYFI